MNVTPKKDASTQNRVTEEKNKKIKNDFGSAIDSRIDSSNASIQKKSI